MTILLEPARTTADALAFAIGGDVTTAGSPSALTRALTDRPGELLVVVGPGADLQTALGLAEHERSMRPALGVVLVRGRVEPDDLVRAMRAGMREVVSADDLPSVAAACARSLHLSHRLLSNLSIQGERASARGQVVTVFSGKGGAGKTTIATNLAAQLARGGHHSVCLVDLDLQFGDVAITLQLDPVHTIADARPMAGHVDEAGLRALMTRHVSGLDALLAPTEPSECEQIGPDLINDILRTLSTMYEYVVIDTPPSFTEHVLVALDRSDLVMLVVTPDVPSVKNLKLTIEMIRLLGMPEESRLVVLNRAESKVGLTGVDVERVVKAKIVANVPSSRGVPTAINRGEVLTLTSPKHPVSVAIRGIAERWLARPAYPVPAYPVPTDMEPTDAVPSDGEPPTPKRGRGLRRRSSRKAAKA